MVGQGTSPASVKRLIVSVTPRPLYRLYRQRKVAWQVRTFAPRWVNHRYGDRALTILLADGLGEAWYDHDTPEPADFTLLRDAGVLREGAKVFDLGAHQAVIALMLGAVVGPSGRVVAVEAEPHNVGVARRNVAANQAENVTVVHAAVAGAPGPLRFAESLNGHVEEDTRVGTVTVEGVTIDGLIDTHGTPDLIYLDIEGFEARALNAASRALGSGRTSFLIEVHVEDLIGASAADLVARFAGWRLHVARQNEAGEPGTFRAYTGGPLPAERFFLAAFPPPY